MICQRCRTGILSRLQPQQTITWTAASPARQIPLQRNQFRPYSDGKASVATPPPPSPRQPGAGDVSIPSAMSSATPGVSQPLSTPEGIHTDAEPGQASAKQTQRQPSSCPAGTKLNGLNYVKNKPDVYAMEDSEYPEWLWGILDEFQKKAENQQGGVDPSSMFFWWFVRKCLLTTISRNSSEQESTEASRQKACRSGCSPPSKDP